MAYSEKPIPPSTEEYKFTSSIPHFGFTEEGYFKAVYSEPAPYGGILHRRAVQEYENSHIMLAHGVPSQVSLLVARLPARFKFMDEDMGIVASLSEEIEPFRLHLIHFGENELNEPELKYYKSLREINRYFWRHSGWKDPLANDQCTVRADWPAVTWFFCSRSLSPLRWLGGSFVYRKK